MERAMIRVVLERLDELLSKDILSEAYGNFVKARENLQKLKSKISTVQSSLTAADWWSLHTGTQPELLDLITKLKDAAFDADDVLEACDLESRRREAIGFIRKTLGRFSFNRPVGSDVSKVLERLGEISEERSYHLNIADAPAPSLEDETRQTFSLPSEPKDILGREADLESVVDLLLRDASEVKLGVVSIVGMGGLGKSTLATMVRFHDRIKSKFLIIWVSVYKDLGLMSVARKILESLGSSAGPLVERSAKEKLDGKRFLLVLDDVWDERSENWEELRDFLRCGKWGSRVLVTTRSKKVALMMHSEVYSLGLMSDDECWLLFKQRAFGWGLQESEELTSIGKEIAKKSKGLPLVARVLGGSMIGKRDVRQWVDVRDNGMWDCFKEEEDSEKEILPALKLSYFHLPSNSKPCFAYLAIFRKDYKLDREKVIQQWVANGLIKRRGDGDRELESIGGEIFDGLLERCLLEDTKRDKYYWDVPIIKMHDMIHDLARFIAKNECHIWTENQTGHGSSKNILAVRFLSIDVNPLSEFHEVPFKAPKLRTMITLSPFLLQENIGHDMLLKMEKKFLINVFEKFKRLRVLDLHLSRVDEVPDSIGNLKHLSYLNLPSMHIKKLPESICSLLNLRTLMLGSSLIHELPKDFKNLSHLRHLYIQRCRLFYMPGGIGQLSSLQTLTDFFVSKEPGSSSLSELQGLNLCGNLTIRNLENVKDEMEVASANLSRKEDLDFLCLSWTKGTGANLNNQPDAGDILVALKPHCNLNHLRLSNFCGTRLPSWMADPSSRLVKIDLWYCGSVDQLQAFGQLKFLIYLQLVGLQSLRNIGSEFYGENDTCVCFCALKELAFGHMRNLQQWSSVEGRRAFPLLHSLTLKDCPLLEVMPKIPAVRQIELWNCNDKLLESVADQQSLSVVLAQNPNWRFLPERSLYNLPSLKKLSLVDCVELSCLPSEAIQQLPSLEKLIIKGCIKLACLPDSIDKLISLQRLEITYCIVLATLPKSLHTMSSLKSVDLVGCLDMTWDEAVIQKVCALEEFHVEICNQKTNLSSWLCYSGSLLELKIQGDHLEKHTSSNLVADRFLSTCCCEDLRFLPEEMKNASSLEELMITSCGSLTNLNGSLENLRQLRYLYVEKCPNLNALCQGLQQLNHLRVLLIKECPEVEKKCKDEKGEYWHLVSHIPDRKIG